MVHNTPKLASFTAGDSPYPGYKGKEVADLVQSGYRMSKPKHLSDDM